MTSSSSSRTTSDDGGDDDSKRSEPDSSDEVDADTDANFAREAAERTAIAALELADTSGSDDGDDVDSGSSEHIGQDDDHDNKNIYAVVNAEDEHDDDEDGDDVLGAWQQFVFQRPAEGLTHLELFASSDGTFDHLLVLNLQENALQDLSPLIATARTLRVLDVSRNAIAQLPTAAFWSCFGCLRMCFLAHNRLQHWRDMDGLEACGGTNAATLLWLTLHGNPLMALANARAFVVNRLPLLRALDDFVVTDQEYMRTPGTTSTRFAAMAPPMDISGLIMPLEFADDNFALAYVNATEARIQSIHAKNSPSIIMQRVVRGFLSRCSRLPRLAHICSLVVKLQARVRGFLFRQLLARSFEEFVARQGQQHLLTLSSTDSPLLPTTARRGLKKLVVYVQEWQRKFHAKKQAIAITKIRFWCQMAYQRYVNKSKLLLQEEHEVCVYYTPTFETELLAIAEKAAHRDPFLMAMTPDDRAQFIRARCTRSGVSVLRAPHQSTCSLQVDSPMVRVRRTHVPGSKPPKCRPARKATGDNVASMTAVVRVFPSDFAHENHLLITEKQFLHSDLERIASLQREHQLAVASTSSSSDINSDFDSSSGTSREKRVITCDDVESTDHRKLPRAVLVHLTQLAGELEKRLVICNKKILAACIKLQQWQARSARMRFAITRIAIRARGYYPTRWERRKLAQLLCTHVGAQSAQYGKMCVLIPWSIDMYLQIMAMLDRTFGDHDSCGSAFALSYEQTRKINAVVTIQSAWRAFARQTRRHALEVAITRARLCLQRWWRFRLGLRRRLDFIRACVLLAASITSRTLFMEASVYHALASAASWSAVRAVLRPCKEQSLHCRMVEGKVEVALSPNALLLRNHSQHSACGLGVGLGSAGAGAASFRAASAQRCGAYLPVWLPGAPEHREVSMSARDEDATPLLLVDNVVVEPTLLERELILGPSAQPQCHSIGSDNTEMTHATADTAQLLQRFAMCRRVTETSARVVELSRRVSGSSKHLWTIQSSVFTLRATSFVRLTFSSVDEARRRALVLLSKTFDPVTKSFAQLHSIEALGGVALRHHQWALGQVASPDESVRVLADCAEWLHADFPSPWWRFVQRKLSTAALAAIMLAAAAVVPPTPVLPLRPTRPDSASSLKRATAARDRRRTVAPMMRATSSPSKALIPHVPLSPCDSSASAAVLLHVLVPGVSCDSEQPVPRPSSPPSSPSTPPASAHATSMCGSSRHQLLTDRVSKPKYESLDDMREAQLEERVYTVRDLREERERAMEALIIDRRMIQREHAAEVAGAKLDIDVKLQRLRYAREIERLHVRELIEQERLAGSRRTLTRRFEQSFAAQTGAMMRFAARESVTQQHEQRHAVRNNRAASLQQRNSEARERRQDAKSYWFVRNQRAKVDMNREHIAGAEQSEETAHVRRVQIRKRVKEEKEIKAMLRLM